MKRLTGKTITLEVDPMESIGNVKAKIEDEEHISPDEQRLILKGKELDDSYTLDYYNIHEGSQVYLVFKSTGIYICKLVASYHWNNMLSIRSI